MNKELNKKAAGEIASPQDPAPSKEVEMKLGYEEAVAMLEESVRKIEDSRDNLSGIEEELKKAMELLKYCRRRLKGIETDFGRILGDEEEI